LKLARLKVLRPLYKEIALRG